MLKNLPSKSVKEPIGKCEGVEGQLRIYNNEGYMICEINYNPEYPEDLARSISRAIIDARDVGYKQCQKDLRWALGITADARFLR